MSSNILIVESPAKSRTIKKYLGPDFEVLASYGHVRDLIPKGGAVDTDNDFEMKYEAVARNKKHVDKIVQMMRKSDCLYLATDPDREGEAISWHLFELLKAKKALKDKKVYRVVFYEITKEAVQEAVNNPRELSDTLINAQQARRALDYLVGFNLSPLLWRKVSSGLSAGRVQSPALRLLVEREEEIEAFEPREYWTIEARLEKDTQPFVANLVAIGEQKLKQFNLNNEKQSTDICAAVTENANGKLKVDTHEKKQRKRNPPPPLITSTLQQECARRYGFTSSRTMRVAQQLYEGVDLGSGAVGLITYMRTDSVTLSENALRDLRAYIKSDLGADKLPDAPRRFKTKSKNAQEAHEAIRPTSAARAPAQVKSHLSEEQFKLYSSVWARSVASQMIHATIDQVAAELSCGDGHIFRATGSTVKIAGYLEVYPDRGKSSDKNPPLPALAQGDEVTLKEVVPTQRFTEPPPRYNEATLIKTLEEHGIGRPSTYASIISTLQSREYAVIESKAFHPTTTGRIVTKFLTEHFAQYVNYDFTARLEDKLDEISRGEKEWVPVLSDFWRPFKKLVEDKTETVSRQDVAQARELGAHPESGRPISARLGRYGPYVQMGQAEDEQKPQFASLKKDQAIETITLEEALGLLKLPRELGTTDDDEPISVAIGRFGPYVKYGDKYVSLPKEDDPYTIERARALDLIEEKKEADAKKLIREFPEQKIKVLNGHYGPYVTDGKKNVKVPKDTDPASLTPEQCVKMIEEAPAKKKRAPHKKKSA